MFQYLYNVISTIVYSICIILGSIITGRQVKTSLYHLDKGLDSIFTKATWFDNDSTYRWKSRNADLIELNTIKLKEHIMCVLNNPNEFQNFFHSLTEKEKKFACQQIMDLIQANNRKIL